LTTPSTSLSAPAAGTVRARGDRLGTAVVASLVDDIVSGRLPAGDTLPTEAEIGDHFGVSRTVVRESVKLLQDKGLVLIHRGVGTVVRSSQSWDMIDEIVLSALVHNDESLVILDELVAVRAALEREMAITAAAARTPEQLDAIKTALRAMERTADDPTEFALADAAFHDVVMTTSGNRLGRAIVTSIHDKARTTGRYHGTTSAAYTAMTLDEHRAVVAAIDNGDGAAAGSTMYDHITGSWARRRPQREE
jgi:GntR family transcriptional regulator, galactonate operon transcriptional repressor